jgi:hypothetical protein
VSVTVGVLARLEGLEPPTHDLEARQLSPCFPPVAGPGVRSRVRIASRGQRHRQRLPPPPRGHITENWRGRPIGRDRQPPMGGPRPAVVPMPAGSHPRQAVRASSAPRRQRAGSAECQTTLANPGLMVYDRDLRQAPPTRSVRSGPRVARVRIPEGIRRLVEAGLSRTYQDRLTVSRPHATPVWPSARGTGRGGPKARRALARAGRVP